jgi:Glycosyl hydrolases family 28
MSNSVKKEYTKMRAIMTNPKSPCLGKNLETVLKQLLTELRPKICLLLLIFITPVACRLPQFSAKTAAAKAEKAWAAMPADVSARIRPPLFPARDFPVVLEPDADHWIRNCRSALQNALDACHRAGGGRVVVPAGNYLCDGPLHLRSNVNLHLAENALLRFDTFPQQYLPLVKVRWEGTVCRNYSPLIYAFQQKNIALTGKGVIDGQSLSFWKFWRPRQDPAKKRLRQMGNDLVPDSLRVFGAGWWLRPSLIEFFECENVLVEDLTLRESPFWTLHPAFCKNVTLRRLRITGGFLNDDGIDPDSCEDVLIEDCDIRTEDDAISIKAGRDRDAWSRPGSRNIFVRRCTLRSEKANALCIGSELSGGVERVFFENCRIGRARYGFNFKTNKDRGGFVKNVFARNIRADTCWETLLFFQTDYHSYRGGNFPTVFSDFSLQNIDCHLTDSISIRMNGLPDAPIERVFLENVRVQKGGRTVVKENVRGWAEKKSTSGW